MSDRRIAGRNGSLPKTSVDDAKNLAILAWFLNHPEVIAIEHMNSPLSHSVAALKFTLVEKGVTPKAPDRFDPDKLKSLIRGLLQKEIEEEHLPKLRERLLLALRSNGQALPFSENSNSDHDLLLEGKREELKQLNEQLATARKSLEEATLSVANVHEEAEFARAACQSDMQELGTYLDAKAKIDILFKQLGGTEGLMQVLKMHMGVTVTKSDLEAVKEGTSKIPRAYSDGLTFKELTSLFSEDNMSIESLRMRVNELTLAHKSHAPGIGIKDGLKWSEIDDIIAEWKEGNVSKLKHKIATLRRRRNAH